MLLNEAAGDLPRTISRSLALIHGHSPAGYAIALHYRLLSPSYLFMTFPAAWAKAYAERNLLLVDPTLRWALTHTGRIDWRRLEHEDASGVLALAAEHDMRHGITMAVARDGTRSMATLTRPDRDLRPEEEDEAEAALAALHDATHPDADLDAGQREALRRLSVAFAAT